MIQINLIPDVKQEFIKAQRLRATVISFSIIIAGVSVAALVLLATYVYGAQALRSSMSDSKIDELHKSLASDEDLPHVLTIQNQLSLISEMHTNKEVHSRIFDILASTNPSSPNNINITNVKVNTGMRIIEIEAYASGGYPAAEVYEKTVERTVIRFIEDDEAVDVPLASNITIGETSYGQDSSGVRVLRFKLSFEYSNEVFARDLENAEIVGPEARRNVTDSYLRLPKGLFSAPASDLEEEG